MLRWKLTSLSNELLTNQKSKSHAHWNYCLVIYKYDLKGSGITSIFRLPEHCILHNETFIICVWVCVSVCITILQTFREKLHSHMKLGNYHHIIPKYGYMIAFGIKCVHISLIIVKNAFLTPSWWKMSIPLEVCKKNAYHSLTIISPSSI